VSGLEIRSFETPDEVQPFAARGELQILRMSSGAVSRVVHEPGWRWKTDVAPLTGADRCPKTHRGYVVSGRLRIVTADGEEGEAGPGDVVHIAPGHDAWVVGDEPCVLVDFA
jgi:hypothetical protein